MSEKEGTISRSLRRTRLSRQADIVRGDTSLIRLLIVGCGGIGSHAARVAAAIGITDITLVDPDTVSEENVHPGWFPALDASEGVGAPKVDSLGWNLEEWYGVAPEKIMGELVAEDDEVFEQLEPPYSVVVVATDSLASRKQLWFRLRGELGARWWLDARMGGPFFTLYTVDWAREDNIEAFESNLKRDKEGRLPCGMKATAPITGGIGAGLIGQTLVKIANEEPTPYLLRYDMQSSLFITLDDPPPPVAQEQSYTNGQ